MPSRAWSWHIQYKSLHKVMFFYDGVVDVDIMLKRATLFHKLQAGDLPLYKMVFILRFDCFLSGT